MIDREALAARVRVVDAACVIEGIHTRSWYALIRMMPEDVRISLGYGNGDLYTSGIQSARHRRVLRAVLNYLDETEGV
jgi:hypothetical protein